MPGSDSYASSSPPLGFDQAWIDDQIKNGSGTDLLAAQILSQGTYEKWTGEGYGSILANAQAMAKSLETTGITRLEDFAVKKTPTYSLQTYTSRPILEDMGDYYNINGYKWVTVDDEGYQFDVPPNITAQLPPPGVDQGDGWDDGMVPRKASLEVQDGESREYYNKATGKALTGQPYVNNDGVWSGTSSGDGRTHFRVNFTDAGMPIFGANYGGDTSDWGLVSPILTFASIIPGPWQPFAMAINAGVAASQGNYVGAVLGALGSAGAFGTEFLNSSIMDLNIPFDQAATNLNTFSGTIAQNLGTIQNATQAVSLFSAVEKGSLAGIINGLVGVAPQIGITIPSDAMKPIIMASTAAALAKGDYAGAAQMAGTITSNPALKQNLQLASSADRLIKAVETGNPSAIMGAGMGFAKTAEMGISSFQDIAKGFGLNISADDANSIMSGEVDGETYFKTAQDKIAQEAAREELVPGLSDLEKNLARSGLESGTQYASIDGGVVSDAGGQGGRPRSVEDIAADWATSIETKRIEEASGRTLRELSNAEILSFRNQTKLSDAEMRAIYDETKSLYNSGNITDDDAVQSLVNRPVPSFVSPDTTGVEGAQGNTPNNKADTSERSFWSDIGLDPNTFSDSSHDLSNDEIMALVGYGKDAKPPEDGSGKPVFGDVAGSFSPGMFGGTFSFVSQDNNTGSTIYENDGFALIARADGTSFVVDKTEPEKPPIWVDLPQTEEIIKDANPQPVDPPKPIELPVTPPVEPPPPVTPPKPVELPVTPPPAPPTPVPLTPVQPPVEPPKPVEPPVTPKLVEPPTANVTPKEVQQIVNDAIKTNPSLTAEDVQKIVSDAVKTVPNLTADQVKKIVGAEVTNLPVGVTQADVQKTVDAAKTELTKAIEKVAAGAASGDADLKKSIDALKAAGLTSADVQKVVDASAANQSAATKQAVADATKGLATTASLDDAKIQLTKAIENVATGAASGNADLNKAIEALKASGLTASDVQKTVDASSANQSSATKQAITDATKGLATGAALEKVRDDLSKEIQAANDIGLKGDAALQAGLDSMAAKMGVNQAEVLKQLGTSTDALRKEFGTGLADVSAAQKAEADARIKQGQALQDTVADAQKTTAGQIAGLETKTTEQYNTLTATQKAEADARVAQGQSLQEAIDGVSGQVAEIGTQLTQQGKDFAAQLVQQGMDYNTAMQTALAAQTAVFGTQIGGVQSDIAANEARRISDQQAAAAASEAQRQADIKAQLAREAGVAKQSQITNIRGQAQQLQTAAQQLPQMLQQASTTTNTPIYGAETEYLDLNAPLDFGFLKPSREKQANQNTTKQSQTTKIASGGYIDDLLSEDMTVDELLNLLR